jgi:hypothetical protein
MKRKKALDIRRETRMRTATYLREIAKLLEGGRCEVLKARIEEMTPTTISITSLDSPHSTFPTGNMKVELELEWVQ